MANELLETYGTDIEALTLIPSGGGVFEVVKDGKLIFSKKKLGRHAEEGEIRDLVEKE